MALGLSKEEVDFYNTNGYVVLPKFWSIAKVQILKAASDKLLSEYEPPISASVFSTDEQVRTSDDYFLSSGDKIRYFFESESLDGEGKLRVPKEVAINKIGHNLHELHPSFREVSLECPRVVAICKSLGIKSCLVPQSMLICKPPRIGGAVKPHVDGAFLYTTPQSVVGFWWPLEDCTLKNGCLWVVPGSHVNGVKRRFKRNAAGNGTQFDPPHDEGFSCEGAVPLEVPAGSLVLIHSAVVHFSHANSSENSRYAYSIHVVDGTAVWDKENWLQRPTPFPALY